jgi:hypothetical protein
MKKTTMKKWKTFLKESTTFATAGQYNSYNDPKDSPLEEVAYFDEEGEVDYEMRDDPGTDSMLDSDEVGQFITDHDGEEAALAYLDAMRQEIYDLMAEEDEEIKFAKENPEYTTRPFDDEEEEL